MHRHGRGCGGLNLSPAASYLNNVNAGTATASYDFTGDGNHDGSSDNANFVINKAKAAVTVNGYTGVYDGLAHGATGQAVGVKGESLAGLSLGDSFTNVPGGTAHWTFSDVNYMLDSGDVPIVINKASSTTTVTCPASVTYTGDAQTPCTVTVVGAGGLNLSPAASYTNNVNAGTATASYDFAGDGNHDGSSDAETFAIAKAASTTTVSCPRSVTYTGVRRPLVASRSWVRVACACVPPRATRIT